ncbi:hypothetical protein ACIRFF_13260 [Streptomyces cyaneofuscatus]
MNTEESIENGIEETSVTQVTQGDEHRVLLSADTNGDGKPDVWVTDTTGDGTADLYQFDTTGDGTGQLLMLGGHSWGRTRNRRITRLVAELEAARVAAS